MKKTLRLLLGLFLVYALSPSLANAEPQIDDFLLKRADNDLIFSFSFREVTGGLSRAKFTIGYIWERGKKIIEVDAVEDLELVADKGVVFSKTGKESFDSSNGKFEAVIPIFSALKAVEPADKFTFFIFLKDAGGKKSNVISGDYVFDGKLAI